MEKKSNGNDKWKSRTYAFVMVAFLIATIYLPLGWLSEGTWKFVVLIGAGSWTIKKGFDRLGRWRKI